MMIALNSMPKNGQDARIPLSLPLRKGEDPIVTTLESPGGEVPIAAR